jgi:hypothetical protein
VSENTRIALISASAAIFGALAGGLTTYITTQQAEKSQDRRDERRLDEEAAGVARHLIVEFREAVLFTQTIATFGARTNRNLLRVSRVAFPLEASAEDLGLLYSRLSWREFQAVADGLSLADFIGVRLSQRIEIAALREAKQDAARWVEAFAHARDAVRRVARRP